MKMMMKSMFLVLFFFMASFVVAQKFEPVKEIPQGKALVYIYRPGSMVGAAVSYTVNANEEKVSDARLKNKSYLVYFANPGRYTFWAQVTNTRREIDLDVEAGKTYYIKGDCCEFKIPETADAEKDIVKCNLSVEKD
jgi:hypothetical protein